MSLDGQRGSQLLKQHHSSVSLKQRHVLRPGLGLGRPGLATKPSRTAQAVAGHRATPGRAGLDAAPHGQGTSGRATAATAATQDRTTAAQAGQSREAARTDRKRLAGHGGQNASGQSGSGGQRNGGRQTARNGQGAARNRATQGTTGGANAPQPRNAAKQSHRQANAPHVRMPTEAPTKPRGTAARGDQARPKPAAPPRANPTRQPGGGINWGTLILGVVAIVLLWLYFMG
ncbi:hypothetical protein [Lacticaseibacillus suihuaensis]